MAGLRDPSHDGAYIAIAPDLNATTYFNALHAVEQTTLHLRKLAVAPVILSPTVLYLILGFLFCSGLIASKLNRSLHRCKRHRFLLHSRHRCRHRHPLLGGADKYAEIVTD